MSSILFSLLGVVITLVVASMVIYFIVRPLLVKDMKKQLRIIYLMEYCNSAKTNDPLHDPLYNELGTLLWGERGWQNRMRIGK